MSEAPERPEDYRAMGVDWLAESYDLALKRIAELEQERDALRKESEYWMDERQKTYRQLARLREAMRESLRLLDHRTQPAGEIEAKRILRGAEQGEPK